MHMSWDTRLTHLFELLGAVHTGDGCVEDLQGQLHPVLFQQCLVHGLGEMFPAVADGAQEQGHPRLRGVQLRENRN